MQYILTEEEYKNWEESVTGEFEGIGIVFSTDEDGNYVIKFKIIEWWESLRQRLRANGR